MRGEGLLARKGWLFGLAAVILLTAAGLRLVGLPRPPAGPYYDEAANGILASAIANEGYRPIFIASYTGKEVLFFYLAALSIKLGGSTLLALRLTSAVLGILTVAATFWCIWELYTDRENRASLALLTGGLLATSFWHLNLSRVGLRAVAQPLFQALTLALLWRGLRTGRRWTVALGGVFCGLSAYTYLAARLFPFPLATTLLALWLADRRQRRRRAGQIGLFVGLAALTFAPLGLYFIRHPEQFAVRIQQVAAEGASHTLTEAFAQAFGIFWVAGDPLARFNLPGQPLFGPILAVAFVVGLLIAGAQLFGRRAPLDRARAALLMSWIPFMILPTALTVADIIPHYLRAAGLLPLIYLFPALAIDGLVRGAGHFFPNKAKYLVVPVLLALVAAGAWQSAGDFFGQLAHRSDHYEISDGDLADMADWLNQQELGDQAVYVAAIHYRHPTLAFLADDYASLKWLTGGRTLVIPADRPALVLVPRSIDYAWATPYLSEATRLPTPEGPDGQPAFSAYQVPAGAFPPARNELVVDFSHVIQLQGYEALESTTETVDLALHWQVLNPPPQEDLVVFIHLVDAWQSPWAEKLPFQYPSAEWMPGETFVDHIRVNLPPGTPPGRYTAYVGLYSAGSNSNLTVVNPDGSFGGLVAQAPLDLTLSATAGGETPENIRRRLNLDTGLGATLLGYNLDSNMLRTREALFVTLFWQTPAQAEEMTVQLSLADQILYQGAPVHGSYPSSSWPAGAVVQDRYNPRIPLDTPAGKWPLTLSWFEPDGESGSVELGQVQVISPERNWTQPPMQTALHETLGDTVELAGYDLVRDGGALTLTLFWQAQETMEQDYTVFVHLLAADGTLISQADRMPQNGEYPTSWWASGEVVSDQIELALPKGATPPYSFRVGLYVPTTGEQLGQVSFSPPPGD